MLIFPIFVLTKGGIEKNGHVPGISHAGRTIFYAIANSGLSRQCPWAPCPVECGEGHDTREGKGVCACVCIWL